MPSEAEQNEAREYVRTHELVRPDTSYFRVFCYITLGAACCIASTVLMYSLIYRLAGSRVLLKGEDALTADQSARIWAISILIVTIGAIWLFGKRAAIGLIRLYQHYAPEKVRRRCLFKPTCSEYAILALEKYGLIKGLYMAYERLFIRCRGNIYMIDEP